MSGIYKIIFAILGVALIVAGYSRYKSCSSKQMAKVDTVYKIDFEGTQHLKDQFNQEHARNKTLELELLTLADENKQKDKQLKARAARLKIKESQIKNLRDMNIRLSAKVSAPLDTILLPLDDGYIEVPHFVYKDTFTRIEGWVQNPVTIKYDIDVPIQTTSFSEKTWFLGKEHLYVDGTSPNTNAHITGINNTEIVSKNKHRFVYGFLAGMAAAVLLNIHRHN